MKGLLLVIILLHTHALFAQKTPSIPVTTKGDTSLLYKIRMAEVRGMGLPDLTTTTDLFYIRIWEGHRVLDIWSVDDINYAGTISHFTDSYTLQFHDTNDFRFRTESISDNDAKVLAEYYTKNQISRIPDCDSISNWPISMGCGSGGVFEIEYATAAVYTYKAYVDARKLKNLPEARLIHSFQELAFPSGVFPLPGKYEKSYERFRESMPENWHRARNRRQRALNAGK